MKSHPMSLLSQIQHTEACCKVCNLNSVRDLFLQFWEGAQGLFTAFCFGKLCGKSLYWENCYSAIFKAFLVNEKKLSHKLPLN